MKGAITILSILFALSAYNCSTTKQSHQSYNIYHLDRIVFDIRDNEIRNTVQSDYQTNFNLNQELTLETFNIEREKLYSFIIHNVDPYFQKSSIQFLVDTTQIKGKFIVTTVIK